MKTLNISPELNLGVEFDNKKIRLIIYRNNIELVCRKTTFKEVNKFLEGTAEKLFKGRLQLLKDEGNIVINIKNNVALVIDRQAFIKYLASA